MGITLKELFNHWENKYQSVKIFEPNNTSCGLTSIKSAMQIEQLRNAEVLDWRMHLSNILFVQVEEYQDFILTPIGREKVANFIKECEAKRKEILDAGLDTTDDTVLPDEEAILGDVNHGVGLDEDWDYYNMWGITDSYDSDTLGLSVGIDLMRKKESVEIDSYFRDIPDMTEDVSERPDIDRMCYTFQILNDVYIDVMCITDYTTKSQFEYVMETGEGGKAYERDKDGKEITLTHLFVTPYKEKCLCNLARDAYDREYKSVRERSSC